MAVLLGAKHVNAACVDRIRAIAVFATVSLCFNVHPLLQLSSRRVRRGRLTGQKSVLRDVAPLPCFADIELALA